MSEKEQELCDVCGELAVYDVIGGPVREQADTWGHDRPYPENHVARCEKHKNDEAFFGNPWGWRRL